MPRRRTSNRPIKRRIRLATQQDVQSELGKVYREVDCGVMTTAEGTRRAFLLDKLRASGLPDARTKAGNGHTPLQIQIFSVPSCYFLSMAQIEAMKRDESFVDVSQCTPMQLEHEPQQPTLEISAPVEIDTDIGTGTPTAPRLVTFPRLVSEKPDDDNHSA